MKHAVSGVKTKKLIKMLSAIALVFSCATIVRYCHAVDNTKKDKTFTEVIASVQNAAKFRDLIAIPGIDYDKKVATELGPEKPVVFFVPTDKAFEAWGDPDGLEKAARADKESPALRKLKRILKGHVYLVIGGSKDAMRPEKLAEKNLETAGGENITATPTQVTDGKGNKAKITDSIEFNFGFIHVIDKVLLPKE